MKSIQAVYIVAIICAGTALCKDKPLSWQEAKVIDISTERIGEGGIHQVGGTVFGPGSGNIWRDKGVTYTVRIADVTYTASEFSMAHHKLKPERVKVGAVKVAVKSDTVLVLRGDDGKDYDLQITKRTHQ
jgi:hypothetical protein